MITSEPHYNTGWVQALDTIWMASSHGEHSALFEFADYVETGTLLW